MMSDIGKGRGIGFFNKPPVRSTTTFREEDMSRPKQHSPTLNWHLLFLGRIYSFIGWLGMLGGLFLLMSMGSTQAAGTLEGGMIFGMPMVLSAFLLICWSVLLLNFSKDITGQQKWSTGAGGWVIGLFNLVSVPIGTAIGTYTLWILFQNHRLQSR